MALQKELCNDLGLSLHEIKSILESGNQYKIIMELLNNQREKTDNKMQDLKELSDKLTYLLLCFYMIILLLTCILGTLLDSMYLAIGIDVILLFVLIYIHATQNAYVCPKCHKKFVITFLKDMLTLNNGKKGKYLKCPYCHQKSWIAETYKDD